MKKVLFPILVLALAVGLGGALAVGANPDACGGEVLDSLNIGDTASEGDHNLAGWTNIWSGCGWCGPDGNMRLIWGDGGESSAPENNWASVQLDAGCYWATCLKVQNLEGAADDGFNVYVNGDLVGTDEDTHSSNTWCTTYFDISSGHYSGLLTIRFEATGEAWSGIGTYGQVAFNEIKLYGLQYYPVAIDIKPGSDPNSVNLGSRGVVPVAILSSATFDATQVDPSTVTLAGAGVAVRGKGNKSLAHEEDVNGNGLLDLVVQVETENLDPNEFQDGLVCLTATFGGLDIQGCDEIVIVPPE